MSLLDTKKNRVVQQNLGELEKPGKIFMIRLLMKEKCDIPDKVLITSIMEKHLGEIACFNYSSDMCGFAPHKYSSEFKDCKISPQLIIMKSTEFDPNTIDEIAKSQMRDCDDSEKILAECKYQVVATDMLAGGVNYKERAEMLMNYMEALVEAYPQCVAVQFQTSGKMFTREDIINHKIPKKDRFIYFAVNIRLFHIEGTTDHVVDSLGMSTLFLPDLQYHFHTMDVNWIINHAYNLLSYTYDNDCPFENGDTIDGITQGETDMNSQWPCHFEDALIQPARSVIDVCMGGCAAGIR